MSFASTSADKNLPYTLLKKNISNFDYSESTYLIKNDSKVVTFEKLLFQNYDETFVDDTSLDLVELDDNLDEIFNGIKDIWGEPNSMEIPVMA